MSHAALSVFTGGFIYSMLIFITTGPALLIGVMLVSTSLLLFVFRKQTDFQLTLAWSGIAAFAVSVAVIVLISAGDIHHQFTAVQLGSDCYGNDDFFFTSVVASMRHGSIFNAAYETGSPLNYQILGFFIPSLLACVLGVSSHLAVWCLAGPLYILLALLLCYEVCYYHLRASISRKNVWFIILAIVLPILLAPLHPLYVAKGSIKNFIFNGMGYLVPAGTITYPVSIAMFLFCLLLFSAIDWADKKITASKVFFTVCLALILIGKGPLYVCFMLFLGVIVLKRIIANKEKITNYLWYFIASLALSVGVLKICMGQNAGGTNFFRYGFLSGEFAGWYHRSTTGAFNNLIIIALILLTYLLWSGLRLVGLVALLRSKATRLNEFFFGAIISLIGVTIFASFLHMQIKDSAGNILQDATFNVEQFIRSGFYILTIVATIGLLYLFYSSNFKPIYVKAIAVITSVWCCLSLSTLGYNAIQGFNTPPCPQLAWYTDNYNQLKAGKYDDGLIAVNPSSQYGIMLASSDYGRYWSAFDRSGTANYNGSIKNEYRWLVFRKLLAHPEEKYLSLMKSDGVKYIIATPLDTAQLREASIAYPALLRLVPDSKWVYSLD